MDEWKNSRHHAIVDDECLGRFQRSPFTINIKMICVHIQIRVMFKPFSWRWLESLADEKWALHEIKCLQDSILPRFPWYTMKIKEVPPDSFFSVRELNADCKYDWITQTITGKIYLASGRIEGFDVCVWDVCGLRMIPPTWSKFNWCLSDGFRLW